MRKRFEDMTPLGQRRRRTIAHRRGKPSLSAMDTRNWPVMKKQCATCPLRKDKLGIYVVPDLAHKVEVRCLTEGSQICHHPRLKGKPETHLCRGGRNFQLMIMHRMGLLAEPTDKCWKETDDRITRERADS